jgi:hypothetical protein
MAVMETIVAPEIIFREGMIGSPICFLILFYILPVVSSRTGSMMMSKGALSAVSIGAAAPAGMPPNCAGPPVACTVEASIGS